MQRTVGTEACLLLFMCTSLISLLALVFSKFVEMMIPERYCIKESFFTPTPLALTDIYNIHEKDDHEHSQGHDPNDNLFAFLSSTIPSFRLFSFSNSPVFVRACKPKVPGV